VNNKRINVGSLEFDQIKNNLKEYLKGQTNFSDYNFEGSNLSIILDVLAYNTYYNNLYTNLGLNEAFLDTATKRTSVVSHARNLGYTPRSSSCSRTTVTFSVLPSGDDIYITLPIYTPFRGNINGDTFTFLTQESVTAQKDSEGLFIFSGVEVKEGTIVHSRFEYNELNSIILANNNIDINTLKVRVQIPPTTEYQIYSNSNSFSTLDGESLVYFVREVETGYEISFGDDIIGKQLEAGNLVNISYMVCNNELPNSIQSLSYGGVPLGGQINTISIAHPTSGGRGQETIEEIRFNAPSMYQAQNRAVTALDYEAILLNRVPSIKNVTVWGGENNDPPVYGKVFISAVTQNEVPLNVEEQEFIREYVLDEFKLVSIIPEFVRAEDLSIELDMVIYYDPSLTTRLPEEIRTNVISEILNYDETYLRKFNKIFRSNDLQRFVENMESSIISTVPRLRISRSVTPVFNSPHNYIINIGNPMVRGSILSSPFHANNETVISYIEDVNGILRRFRYINGSKIIIENVGSINYQQGTLNINGLMITKILTPIFKFSMIPSSPDVVSKLNQVVRLDADKLKISLVADETSKGRILKGQHYKFTPSRL